MRVADWPEKLAAAIADGQSRRFAYGGLNGTQDCALFAADCVLAMTGVDHAANLRGYDSKESAYRIVAEYGSLEAMVTALLGHEPVHPAFARRGDVVLGTVPLAAGESGEMIGICEGVHSFYSAIIGGLVAHSTLKARIAWRIE